MKKNVSLKGKRENQDENIEDIQVIDMWVKFILALSEESAHSIYTLLQIGMVLIWPVGSYI